jgi:hypothetical protein
MEETNNIWNDEMVDDYLDDIPQETDEQGRPLSEPMTRGELIEQFEQFNFDLFIHLLFVLATVMLFRG